ncbi:MAG: DUF6089 family protein [Puia sp.]|nr:DUF6089 family protein [Puia sp.]
MGKTQLGTTALPRVRTSVYGRSASLFLIILFFWDTRSRAQSPVLLSRWELGIQASQFIYQGDLAPSAAGSTRTPGYGLGIYGDRFLTRALALRTNLAFGRLSGDDTKYPVPSWRLQRGLSFSTPVFEISEMVVWNIMGDNYDPARPRLSPYLFGGVGYTFLHIKRDASKFNAHAFEGDSTVINGLAADERHALPGAIPVIPIGAGIRYGITPALSVTAEAAYRFTFTDYLDGFSQVANPNKNDRYYTLSVGLVYKFISSDILRCPVIRL